MTPKPLHIFNASAGSGKTYSLVKSYVLILLDTDDTYRKYAEIIAMTFTNKAALEMKTRIIQALDELSNPEIYLEKSKRFAEELALETGTSPDLIHKRARLVLNSILHRYEDFHVLTIDKFNLRLIRSFSRDLDLPVDFEVILNEDLLIEQVVDKMMNEIGKNPELSALVFHYAQSKLEEGERWNFRNSLIEFGKVLSSERDLPIVQQLMDTEFTREHYDELRAKWRSLSNQFLEYCQKIDTHFRELNLVSSDLPGGQNTWNPIDRFGQYQSFETKRDKVFTATLLKHLDDEPAKGKQFPESLRHQIRQFVNWYDGHLEGYLILQKFLSGFFNMALLKYLNQILGELKQSERLVRISEFNTRISELLADEDAPYIFERLGTRFHHFLLDEFQDTSRLQWMNMLPLLRESLAHNYRDLIVGDPKQSIYRFKNGVAEQFVALPGVYNPEGNPRIEEYSSYFRQMGEVQHLDNNWRSSPTIVAFNNLVFEKLRLTLPEHAREFYESVSQHPKSDVAGYVEVRAEQWKTKPHPSDCMDFILSTIQSCEKDGFQRGDICILGGRNKACSYWANELTNRGYKVVSADSLIVDNHPSVRFILSYFAVRLNPSSENLIKQFADCYCQVNGIPLQTYRSFFKLRETQEGKSYRYFDSDYFIDTYFGDRTGFFFRYESLYDLVEQSYSFFGFSEVHNPYLHHFADMVHTFELKNGPDLALFLEDFQTLSDSAKSVQIPESDDAIRIMTIHKSKGLEFPVVIVPQMTEDFKRIRGNFFVDASGYLLHTGTSGSSPIHEIQSFTEEESERRLLDLVNLYYVAFTRPIERLYILNQVSPSSIGAWFQPIFDQLEADRPSPDFLYTSGTAGSRTVSRKPVSDTYFSPDEEGSILWFPDIALQDRPELITETTLSDEQRYGTQFHLAVSGIHDEKTIDNHVDQLIAAGEVEQAFAAQMKNELRHLFSSAAYKELFEGMESVMNEQSLIAGPEELLRPDKIILKKEETLVVDYKTGMRKERDFKQVAAYVSVLREIGFPNVRGYLFYTHPSELVAI